MWLDLVTDWQRLKLKWGYLLEQKRRPFTIQPGEEMQLPTQDYIFDFPEGVLIELSAGFDHPNCGVMLDLNPELHTGRDFTVANILAGLYRPENIMYAFAPPTTTLGTYGIRICSPWPFFDWMRLYVFNNDTVAHNCTTVAYHVAVLKEPRPDDRLVPLETLKKLQLAYEMYPEARNVMRKTLAETVDGWLKEQRVKTNLEKEVG